MANFSGSEITYNQIDADAIGFFNSKLGSEISRPGLALTIFYRAQVAGNYVYYRGPTPAGATDIVVISTSFT